MTQVLPEQQQAADYYEQAQSEWESAFVAYRAGQARLSYAAAFLTYNAWREMVRPTSFVASLSRWLDYAVRIIRAFRAHQRRLAQSYYQYGRALEVRESFGQPLSGRPPTVAGYRDAFLDQLQDVSLLDSDTPSDWDAEDGMGEIREELRSLVAERDRAADEDERSQREINYRSVDLDRAIQRFLDAWEDDGDHDVQVMGVEWPDRDADGADGAHREHFRELARDLWDEEEREMGREEAVEDDDEEEAPSRRDRMMARLEEAADLVGNRVAGRVMQATSHAADAVTNWAMDRDRRVYGVARGTGPNPCALCAVAAARGFVYRSVSSAMTTRSGGTFKRYHENCQCYPIIRWSPSQAEPETTLKWRRIYEAAKGDGGNTFDAFRRRLHSMNASSINARRRRYYAQNKNRINARRRARRRSGR